MPRQVDRDARLDAMCDAVAAVAIRAGFGAVTIRRVAAEMGASTSVVTHYVSGREQLLRVAVRRQIATRRADLERLLDEHDAAAGDTHDGTRAPSPSRTTAAAPEPAAPSPTAAAAGLRAIVEWSALDAEAAHRLWLALVVGAQQEQILRDELDAFNDWWDAVVGQLARVVAGDATAAAALVDAIDVIVDGLVITGFDEGEPWSPARRRRALDRLLLPLGL